MPTEEVTVHLNRGRPGSLEVAGDGIETRDSFVLRLENHGDPVHVHARLSETLEAVAGVDGVNHYVERDGTATVPVSVEPDDEDVDGSIELSTRFGANEGSIPVTVPGGPRPVDVDERLARPKRPESEAGSAPETAEGPAATAVEPARSGLLARSRLRPGTLGVFALAALALAIALAAGAVVGGAVALAAVAVVGGGLLAALAILLR